MMPILFVLLLSFFGCDAAVPKSPRDARKELAVAGYRYDHNGDIVPLTDKDRQLNEIVDATHDQIDAERRAQEAQVAAAEADRRQQEADKRKARGDQARALLPQQQQIDVDDVVTTQPRPQPPFVFYKNGTGDTTTVNTYKGLPTCLCAPVVINNAGAVCPLRVCCACTHCGKPRVVVAGCCGTKNKIPLPKIKEGFYDDAEGLPRLGERKATLNFAPDSVGEFVCICGGCWPTVNQDNR